MALPDGFAITSLAVHWEQFMTILSCLKLSQTSLDPYRIYNIIKSSEGHFQTYLTVVKQSFPSYSNHEPICLILRNWENQFDGSGNYRKPIQRSFKAMTTSVGKLSVKYLVHREHILTHLKSIITYSMDCGFF